MPSFYSPLFRKELIEFYKNIALMVQSGIPLNESLGVFVQQAQSRAFKKFLLDVKGQLEKGSTLSKTLEPYRAVIGDLAINIIRAGELNGTLEENLKYLAEIMNRNRELRQKIKAALLYPEIVLGMTFMLGGGISLFLLPRLIPLFRSLDVELPLVTRLLLWISVFLQENGPWVFGGVLAVFFAFYFLGKWEPVRWTYHTLFLRTPFLGKLAHNYQLALFNQIFGTLFKSGLTIKEALVATGQALTNIRYRNALLKSTQSLTSGVTLAAILGKYPHLFPPNVVALVTVGEKSGKLEESLHYLAVYFENEVDVQTKQLPTLIEPLLLIVIGAAVGFIALAVITPIYELTSGISS